jgi:hypothetical protein
VFGEDCPINGKGRFSRSDLSWDGHAWVVHGNWAADVSIFRTADSKGSPPALAAHVRREFGHGRGVFAAPIIETSRSGFRYDPQYVLTTEQVEALGRGAYATFIAPKAR